MNFGNKILLSGILLLAGNLAAMGDLDISIHASFGSKYTSTPGGFREGDNVSLMASVINRQPGVNYEFIWIMPPVSDGVLLSSKTYRVNDDGSSLVWIPRLDKTHNGWHGVMAIEKQTGRITPIRYININVWPDSQFWG